jgi:hypothetical protein
MNFQTPIKNLTMLPPQAPIKIQRRTTIIQPLAIENNTIPVNREINNFIFPVPRLERQQAFINNVLLHLPNTRRNLLLEFEQVQNNDNLDVDDEKIN